MLQPRFASDYVDDEPQRTPDGIRIKLCAMCGQSYDLTQLAQAYHHDNRPHARMPRRT